MVVRMYVGAKARVFALLDDFLPMPSLFTTSSAHWTRRPSFSCSCGEIDSARRRRVPEGGITICDGDDRSASDEVMVVVADPAGAARKRVRLLFCGGGIAM